MGKKRDDRRQADEKTMEWSDFTNAVLTRMGLFVLMPCVIVGSVLMILKFGVGAILLFGGIGLFLTVTILMVAFKPLLVKKFPETGPVQPVPDSQLEKMSREERNQIPLQTSGRYMVDRSVPYERLSRVQKLAVDQCNGDLELAWEYVFTKMDHQTQREWVNQVTEWEMSAAGAMLMAAVNQRSTQKEIQKTANLEFWLIHMDMTREQVLAAEQNPFAPKAWLRGGLLLASCIIIGILIAIASRSFAQVGAVLSMIVLCLGFASTVLVYWLVDAICNCIRFRKARRALEKEADTK